MSEPYKSVQRWYNIVSKWAPKLIYPLPVSYILAVIHQESSGNPLAKRHEPGYVKAYGSSPKVQTIAKVTGLSVDEICTSYGLMQLMVPTAWGYLSDKYRNRDILSFLYTGELNIRLGSAHLSALFKKHALSGPLTESVIKASFSSYNGSRPRAVMYGESVYSLYKIYDKWILS